MDDKPASEHPLKAGDRVICLYRLPDAIQPWNFGELYVGVIQEPGGDPALWNGYNSERVFCTSTNRLPVQYSWGLMHDAIASLVPENAGRNIVRDKLDQALRDGHIPLHEYEGALERFGLIKPQAISPVN